MSFFTSDTVKKVRLELCEACDDFNKSMRTCGNCGCFMDIKVNLKRSKCPKNKWHEENQTR
jgi:hypothetical protein